ncbi:MAG: hypothetical protein JW724_01735 [Candidatus Altiarchaeota archaeon]|nr:hypothetical protein [Candidatus Altiarchaeota archaeon]
MEYNSLFTFRTLLVFGLCLFFATASFAQVQDVNCNNHYTFDGLKFNDFHTGRIIYEQGDEVTFEYEVENRFGSPLVEGDIKATVMYRGPKDLDRQEDDDIIDEFIAFPDVNIQEGDKYPGSFTWKVPTKAKTGIYSVNLYFPVKKKFNVAGLTFMTSVPAAATSFKVSGAEYDVLLLEKTATFVNGEAYGFRAPLPAVGVNAPVEVKTRLLNAGNEQVSITYELFEWDDLEKRLDEYTREETVSETKDLIYDLPGLPAGVYVARITASSGDWKSIIKTRFFVEGAKGRFIWLGLDHFPLMKDDSVKVGFCLSNTAAEPSDESVNYTVKGTVRVIDAEGKTIAGETYAAPVNALVEGKEFEFMSPEILTLLTVKADMYDEAGNLMDEVEITYDYSKFLNIAKEFALTAEKTGDAVDYEITYLDEYDDPLSGDVVVYMSSSDGTVHAMKEATVKGALSGRFTLEGLAEGDYVIKAVEKDGYLSDEKSFTVGGVEEPVTVPTTAPVQETMPPAFEETDTIPWNIILAAAVILFVALIAVKSMSKKSG